MTGSMLLERLARGPILCAEGYLFELERRGYLQAGAYVPEVVLERPEAVDQLHHEFVHAGSDVVEAFTYDVADFARDALALGVGYLGLCCGAAAHHIRAMAEAMGRRPPASRYSPDMSKHAYLGSDPSLQAENLAFAERL